MSRMRRSTLQTLTEEQQQFMKGEGISSFQPELSPAGSEISKRRRHNQDSSKEQESEGATIKRGQPVRSITLRLAPEIVRALRQVALERSADYVEPFTQKDIAEAAFRKWLADQGYSVD